MKMIARYRWWIAAALLVLTVIGISVVSASGIDRDNMVCLYIVVPACLLCCAILTRSVWFSVTAALFAYATLPATAVLAGRVWPGSHSQYDEIYTIVAFVVIVTAIVTVITKIVARAVKVRTPGTDSLSQQQSLPASSSSVGSATSDAKNARERFAMSPRHTRLAIILLIANAAAAALIIHGNPQMEPEYVTVAGKLWSGPALLDRSSRRHVGDRAFLESDAGDDYTLMVLPSSKGRLQVIYSKGDRMLVRGWRTPDPEMGEISLWLYGCDYAILVDEVTREGSPTPVNEEVEQRSR